MVNRLTWQNVSAPDFSDALQGTAASGELFARAASNFSGALGDIAKNNRQVASTKAMDAAMRVRGVEDWDTLMANGGLASLGIDASQATPEMMAFLQSYREDLTSDRADDLSHQRNQVAYAADQQSLQQSYLNYDKDLYGFGRAKTLAGREDIAYQREEESYQIGKEADKILQGLAATTDSPEKAVREILNADHAPDLERALLGRIDGAGPNWQVDADILQDVMSDPKVGTIGASLDLRRARVASTFGGDMALRLYDNGLETYKDFANPVDGLVDRLRPDGVSDEDTSFKQGRGKIRQVASTLTKKFPGLPPEMVAMALEETLKGKRNWLFILNGDEKLDVSAAEALLEPIQKNLVGFEQQREKRDNLLSAIDKDAAELTQLLEKHARARTQQDPKRIQSTADDLDKFYANALVADANARVAISPKQSPAAGTAAATPQASPATSPAPTTPAAPAGTPAPAAPTPAAAQVAPAGTTSGRNAPVRQNTPPAQPPAPPTPTSRRDGRTNPSATSAATLIAPQAQTSSSGRNIQTRTAPTPAPAPTAAPVDMPAVAQAKSDPVSTTQVLTAELGLDAGTSQVMEQMVTALVQGVGPTGEPITQENRAQITQQLASILERIRQAGVGDLPANDPIRALVEQPQAWLPF